MKVEIDYENHEMEKVLQTALNHYLDNKGLIRLIRRSVNNAKKTTNYREAQEEIKELKLRIDKIESLLMKI